MRPILSLLYVPVLLTLVCSRSGLSEETAIPPISAQELVLPPIPLQETDDLSSRFKVVVKQFEFEGNSVYSDVELTELTKEYVQRELTSEQLEAVRQSITRHYVSNGYINSGAILPDQKVSDGIITFKIVEGILTEVNVSGTKRLRPGFIQKRIRHGSGPPLNINALQDRLQVLRMDANIRRVNAELKPGVVPGESYLDVKIVEDDPFNLAFRLNNHRTPTVGGERLLLNAAHQNVLGFGDHIDLDYGITKDDLDEFDLAGIDDVDVSYTIPVTSGDTTLEMGYRRSDFSIIEEPFTALQISSESENYIVGIRQPLFKTYGDEFTLSLNAERRKSQTFFSGRPFVFSDGADREGISRVTVLRFVQEWSKRSLKSVTAVRSSVNLGIDALGSSDGGKDATIRTTRDSKFFSWLGQFQYVTRLGESVNRLILKSNMQWTDDKSLSMEQFSIGGAHSVRGYRENQIVRDRGITLSAEVRFPVWFTKRGQEILQIAPFFDYGRAANVGASGFDRISSAGLGFLFTPNNRLSADLYWGIPFKDVDNDQDDLQDEGVHFNVAFTAF